MCGMNVGDVLRVVLLRHRRTTARSIIVNNNCYHRLSYIFYMYIGNAVYIHGSSHDPKLFQHPTICRRHADADVVTIP